MMAIQRTEFTIISIDQLLDAVYIFLMYNSMNISIKSYLNTSFRNVTNKKGLWPAFVR